MVNKAYDNLVASGQLTDRQVEVWHMLLREKRVMTVREIREALSGFWSRDHSGVHSRLRELEAVKRDGKRRCPKTGRMVNVWKLY